MAAPRKFDQETRDRAVRMYHDRLKENDDESKLGARRHAGSLLDINPSHSMVPYPRFGSTPN